MQSILTHWWLRMFDPSRYEAEVLNPLRGAHGRLPDGVPAQRYAIDHLAPAELTPTVLRRHLAELRTYWRQQAGIVSLRGQACRMLLAADEQLAAEAGDALEDPAFWLGRGGLPPAGPTLTEPPTDPALRPRVTNPPVRPAGTDPGAGPPTGDLLVRVTGTGPGTEPPPARVAPPRPTRVRAARDGTAVRLTWRAPVAAGAAMRYRVERLRQPPGSANDTPAGVGDGVQDRGPLVVETTETAAVDQSGEAGELWYGVRAAYVGAGRPVWSDPAFAACPAAPGRSTAAATTYLDVPVDADQPLAQVAGFELRTLHAHRHTVRMQLSWQPVPGVDVRVRRGRQSPLPPWPAGTLIDPAGIDRYGEEVVGHRYLADGVAGGVQVLETDVPAGYFVYQPFAVRGGQAMVSRPVGRGSGQQLTDARLDTRGDRVGVLWIWPPGCTQVEVVWQGGPGTDPWTVTRASYQEDGGFWLPPEVNQGLLLLTAITVVPLGEPVRSEPVPVQLTGRRPVVVRWAMPRNRTRPRRRTVTLTAQAALPGLAVSVRYSPGLVMPTDPAAGVPLHELADLALAPDAPLSFPVVVPPELHRDRPYWIRCYFRADVPLIVIDPPVAEMKVP
jgi:hypothetical protein